MSAGSNNIIIAVADQVSPTIEPKIRGIGEAARSANQQIVQLRASLSSFGAVGNSASQAMNGIGTATNTTAGNIGVFINSFNKIPSAVTPAVASVGRMESALAQFGGRVVGAESGLGMLGGAFARVGVAAGLAGPLIVAALVIGSIVGAILIYEKFEKAARALVDAQVSLHDEFARMDASILDQNEAYAALLGGPFAKYKQELDDLSKKPIALDIQNINKVLAAQHSNWTSLVGDVEKYLNLLTQVDPNASGNGANLVAAAPRGTGDPISTQQGQDYIKIQEQKRKASLDTGQGIKDDLQQVGAKLVEIHNLEATLSQSNIEVTEKSRHSIEDYYAGLLKIQTEYNNKHRELSAQDQLATLADIDKQNSARNGRQLETIAKLDTDPTGANQFLLRRQAAQIEYDAELREINAKIALFQKDPTLDQNGIQAALAKRSSLIADYNDKVLSLNQSFYKEEQKSFTEQNAAADKLVSESLKQELDARLKVAEAILANVNAQYLLNISKAESVEASAKEAVNADRATKSVQQQIADQQTLVEAIKATRDAKLAQNAGNIGAAQSQAQSAFDLGGFDSKQFQQAEAALNDFQAQRVSITTEADKKIAASATQLARTLHSELSKALGFDPQEVNTIKVQIDLLNAAYKNGSISSNDFAKASANLAVALANQRNESTKTATANTVLIAGLGKAIAGYQGLAKGISDAYGQAFKTIEDGAATSLSRALVYGENLGTAFKKVAQQAIEQLIGAFIKLGIQWLITEAIAHTVAASSVAVTSATAAAVGAAWAPAAALASLATLGTNAAPADAALSTSVALSESLAAISAVPKALGGYLSGPGSGTSDSIPIAASNGEFIVNAAATAKNRAALESINSGGSADKSVGSGTSPQMNVHVTHDGSTNIQVQQIDANTVRVIAKQEAQNAVQTSAPSIIASHIQNPNSSVSKSIQQNLQAPRKR